MALEIERKFLLLSEEWKEGAVGVHYAQCYLNQKKSTIRVRIAGEKGFLTIKGKTKGISRKEFEYEIPLEDAREMFEFSQTAVVEKYRYKIEYGGKIWEIDEFLGENAGLVVAEVELESENEEFEKPQWIGEEVTDDPRYRNSNLAEHPFKMWE